MADDEFSMTPNEFRPGSGSPSYIPQDASAAWILQLIQTNLNETDLPDGLKKSLLRDMVPYINLAGMTKISMGQVMEFEGGFKELWLRYRIFRTPDENVPELNFVMGYLREMLLLKLNQSVDGWQGDHVYEHKTTQDLRLTRSEFLHNLKTGFLRKRQQGPTDEER